MIEIIFSYLTFWCTLRGPRRVSSWCHPGAVRSSAPPPLIPTLGGMDAPVKIKTKNTFLSDGIFVIVHVVYSTSSYSFHTYDSRK